MKIEIEYCVPCGYLARATQAQTRLLEELGGHLESVALKTGDKGVFTFRANGEEIYSKPEEFDIDAIVSKVRGMLPAPQTVQIDGRDLLMGQQI